MKQRTGRYFPYSLRTCSYRKTVTMLMAIGEVRLIYGFGLKLSLHFGLAMRWLRTIVPNQGCETSFICEKHPS